MTDGAGTVTYNYDNENQLTSTSRGNDTFSYTYDPGGDITTRTYPDSTTTIYTYDHNNRLATTASGGNTTSYAYDPAGQLTTTTLPSGNGYIETRTYDKAGRLTEIKNASSSTTLSDFTQTLDPVGNPTQILRSGATSETATYSYDANDRLTGVCYQSSCPNNNDPYIRWTYDHVGNRLTETRPSGTTTYTYNNADELTAAGSTNYSYDQNGNQTASGSRSFAYDLAERLATTSLSSTTTTYSYDGDGNRLQASTGTGASQKTNYLWDANAVGGLPQLALERDGNNTLLRRYIYGARRINMTSGGNTYYYHYDPIGTVANLTSGSGSTEWTYSYEPFGGIRTETQNDPSAPSNMFKFVSEYSDLSGLYYLRAREYDSVHGVFLSLDPLTSSADKIRTSSYSYAGGRPTVMIDPTGQSFQPSNTGQFLATFAMSPSICVDDTSEALCEQAKEDAKTFAKALAITLASLADRTPKREGEHGPFWHYEAHPSVISTIVASHELWGSRARVVAGGAVAVRAYNRPLPGSDKFFVEFWTPVKPSRDLPTTHVYWYPGSPGVVSLYGGEWAMIPIVVVAHRP